MSSSNVKLLWFTFQSKYFCYLSSKFPNGYPFQTFDNCVKKLLNKKLVPGTDSKDSSLFRRIMRLITGLELLLGSWMGLPLSPSENVFYKGLRCKMVHSPHNIPQNFYFRWTLSLCEVPNVLPVTEATL